MDDAVLSTIHPNLRKHLTLDAWASCAQEADQLVSRMVRMMLFRQGQKPDQPVRRNEVVQTALGDYTKQKVHNLGGNIIALAQVRTWERALEEPVAAPPGAAVSWPHVDANLHLFALSCSALHVLRSCGPLVLLQQGRSQLLPQWICRVSLPVGCTCLFWYSWLAGVVHALLVPCCLECHACQALGHQNHSVSLQAPASSKPLCRLCSAKPLVAKTCQRQRA